MLITGIDIKEINSLLSTKFKFLGCFKVSLISKLLRFADREMSLFFDKVIETTFVFLEKK